ncbi:ECF transporter S component [Aneurinibacillus sp. Ricciae_BoGa-3]|uniref:ECF transporter S component n=1 Tax=Aneurinibacillus sp. Ricciae_BoGa-3 TaxID=3022697 RepID=UPI0023423A08|nr:ECF transporter S component [Aneurinibacillus sp. Ricciae_BoGa-3]WCK56606.1 ECF transporter S component [Aneurinibacillus sp. Ricciae_BoGa-3]
MASYRLLTVTILAAGLLVLSLASLYMADQYLLLSFVIILLSIVPFYVRFELRSLDTREIVLLAILSAVAAVSRIPFAAIPNVKPVTFIIIACAMVFGAEAGFIIGSTAALVSNIFFGQGPWTPWQMFAWGMVGFITGMLKDLRWLSHRWCLALYGFIWGFVFDWFMNISVIIGFIKELTWGMIIASYVTSFYFDLAHACSNALFLYLFGSSWIKILQRFKVKYGLLRTEQQPGLAKNRAHLSRRNPSGQLLAENRNKERIKHDYQ